MTQGSISPTFLSNFFQQKCSAFFCTAFLDLQFNFVIFWQKNIGAKAAHKVLVKMTKGFFIFYFFVVLESKGCPVE